MERSLLMAKVLSNGLGIELHGKAGNAVFAVTQNGLVLRPRTQPRNPRTDAQRSSRARFARASAAYRTLTPGERQEWQQYARTLSRFDPRGGLPSHPTPFHAFVGLASKFLQLHPGADPPSTPPAAPFFGDGITLLAAGGAGLVTFTASGPNADNIVTELLLQPLLYAERAPKRNLYRPQAFIAFAVGSLAYPASAAPGFYAPAVRFVNARTGQTTLLLAIGIVHVT
jgi:hypothetical protein